MAVVELRTISKSFGHNRVLQDVNLRLGQDDICVVVGPSGCGKTTLLRIVAGLDRSFSGEVLINNRDVKSLWPSERDLSMVFQQDSLFHHLTGFQNIAYPLRGRGFKRDEVRLRVEQVAELLEITSILRRRPQAMSGGERQRVAIGRSLVRKPGCLLLDEPMASLDPHLRGQLRELLRRVHRANGGSMLLVSHDQADAIQLGHHVAVLNVGGLEQYGRPIDVYQSPINRFVASFFGPGGMNFLPGEMKHTDGGPQLLLADHQWLPINEQVEDGRRMALGIRPEGLLPAALTSPDWPRVNAVVKSRRPVGAQLEVELLAWESTAIRVSLPMSMSDHVPLVGGQVTFAFDPQRATFFADDQEGKRLDISLKTATDSRLRVAEP